MFVSMLECEMCWHDEAPKGPWSGREMKGILVSPCWVTVYYAIPLSHTSCCYARISWSNFHILSQTLIRIQTPTYANMCAITRRDLFMVIIMNNQRLEFQLFLSPECWSDKKSDVEETALFSWAENLLKCDDSKKRTVEFSSIPILRPHG